MKYLFVFALIAANSIAFQNCANRDFSAVAPEGALVEKSGSDDEAMTIPEEGDDAEGEIPVTGGTTATGGTMATNGTVGNGDTVACTPRGNGNNPNCPREKVPPGQVSDDDGAGLYVCVLAGPGHSVKLAYVQDKLEGKVATPDDVCMSARACTDIVSQVFRVKMPAKRGFCPNKNPHVHHFSDAQIQSLIDDLK